MINSGEFGQPLFHVAINGSTHAARSEALSSLKSLVREAPALASKIIAPALKITLDRQIALPVASSGDDEKPQSDNSRGRFQHLLSEIATESTSQADEFKAGLMADVALASHNPIVDPKGDLFWLRLLQIAKLSPERLVSDYQSQLVTCAMEALLSGTEVSSAINQLREKL